MSGVGGIGTAGPTSAELRAGRGFDLLSGCYDPIVRLVLGRRIRDSRTRFLREVADRPRVLILGEGSGEFLLSLLEAGHRERVVSIDVSREMLRRSERRLRRRRPDLSTLVEFRLGGVGCIEPGESFDLVCTHYFLDLFDEAGLEDVVVGLGRALAAGGRWLVSDFSEPAGPARKRIPRAALLRVLYEFFGLACGIRPRALPPIRSTLERLGFVAERDTGDSEIVWSALYRRLPA